MSESAIKVGEIYVDHLRNRSKPTFFMHGHGNLSNECKVLVYFGFKYDKSRPTKDRRHDTANKKKVNRKQEINLIVKKSVDEILPQEDNKLSSEEEAYENIESGFYENGLYQTENIIIDKNKVKHNDVSMCLNTHSEIHMLLKARIV